MESFTNSIEKKNKHLLFKFVECCCYSKEINLQEYKTENRIIFVSSHFIRATGVWGYKKKRPTFDSLDRPLNHLANEQSQREGSNSTSCSLENLWLSLQLPHLSHSLPLFLPLSLSLTQPIHQVLKNHKDILCLLQFLSCNSSH